MKLKICNLTLLFLLIMFLAIEHPTYAAVFKNKEDFSSLRDRWLTLFTGGNQINVQDPDIKSQIIRNDNLAKKYWDSINKSSSQDVLWKDLLTRPPSSQITYSYERIRMMAQVYSTKGSSFYANSDLKYDILFTLDWMYTHRYNEYKIVQENWWDWEVGAPTALTDTLVLIYKELSQEQIVKYMRPVNKFVPVANQFSYQPFKDKEVTIANAAFKVQIIALQGIIENDHAKLLYTKKIVEDMMKYTISGDGFYEDGSFIYHKIFAYNNGYGATVLDKLSKIIFLLDDTPYEIDEEKKIVVYNWVDKSFAPFLFNGSAMDMVNGRFIRNDDRKTGLEIIQSLLILAETAPAFEKYNLKSLAKNNLSYLRSSIENSQFVFFELQKKVMQDSSIKPKAIVTTIYNQFYRMDKAVYRTPSYALGLSMSSKRIGNFESLNGDNIKGWYTGDGMVSLYNNDTTQFSDGYWETVNKSRLPGITVDNRKRENSLTNRYLSPQKMVGGVEFLNTYGMSAMDFKAYNSTLVAKKSWFFINNQMIALGAGISSKDPYQVETIIDNRKIRSQANNQLYVNNILKASSTKWNEKLIGTKWIFIEGNVANSGIGYYFPTKPIIYGLKENRVGSLSDIYIYGTQQNLSRNYLTFWFLHGNKPINHSYQYIALPNYSREEVEKYSRNPSTTILRNNSLVQAVKEKNSNVIGAAFWAAGNIDFIKVSQPTNIMTKVENNILYFGVTDTSQELKKQIVEFNKDGKEVINKDASIKIIQLSPTIKIEINVTKKMGATQQGSIKLK